MKRERGITRVRVDRAEIQMEWELSKFEIQVKREAGRACCGEAKTGLPYHQCEILLFSPVILSVHLLHISKRQ